MTCIDTTTIKDPNVAIVFDVKGLLADVSLKDSKFSELEKYNKKKELPEVTTHIMLQPILSLIAGILILVFPRVLNYIVGIYLIVFGILGIIR